MSATIPLIQTTAEQDLCFALLKAEDEEEAVKILNSYGFPLSDRTAWHPLGDNAGNFSTIGNQQEDGTAALVEKIVNSIDAVLLEECHTAGVQPESSEAPASMQAAVHQFLHIKDGRIGALSASEQRELATRISLVATGAKMAPCYLVVDSGEGQTPEKFKDTFLSTTRQSPKIRIPFVQGKFNAGGTGTLQFCGKHNMQLIVSRRQPNAPVSADDTSAELWGFTVIRRHRPEAPGDRSSVFEYLAPKGKILRFAADSIPALPGKSGPKKPPHPYQMPLSYGTCVKLYNYKWRGRGLATLEARRELERFLQIPCLPFRVTEARAGYSANYYATTVIGVWNSLSAEQESSQVESGFPAAGELNVSRVGVLPYRLVVWRESLESAHLTSGVYFLVNGQVHGMLPADFVSRTLGFDYIKDHLLIAIDCTMMDRGVAEDLFMASRDRLRKNEQYNAIKAALTDELREHRGLKAANSEWRERRREKAVESKEEVQSLINELVKKDPAFAMLLGMGGTIISPAGPGAFQKFEGKKFPTYFRLEKEPKGGLTKRCPINRTVKVDFTTDAENMYFSRENEPGELTVTPSYDLVEATHLWNGRFSVHFRVPWDASVGDEIPVRVEVSDVTRTSAFVCELKLLAAEESEPKKLTHGVPNPQRDPHSPIPKTSSPALQLPNPIEVRKADWQRHGFKREYEAIKINRSEQGIDFYINVDHPSLVTEMSNKKCDPALTKYWFVWGLTFAGLAMIRDAEDKLRKGDEVSGTTPDGDGQGADLKKVAEACDGLARVIVPVIRTLYQGPGALGFA